MKLIYQMLANVFIAGNRTKQYIALLMCTSWLCEITQEIVIIWGRINPIYASRIERDTVEHLRKFLSCIKFLYRKYLGHDKVCLKCNNGIKGVVFFSNLNICFYNISMRIQNFINILREKSFRGISSYFVKE